MSLDPLKFAVIVKDEATATLKTIEDKLKQLKEQTISVKVEGLSELKSLLETLKGGGGNSQSSEFSKKLAKDVEAATAALKKEEEALANLKTQFDALSKTNEQQAQSAKTLEEAEKRLNFLLEEQIKIRNRLSSAEERSDKYLTEKMAARERLSKKVIDETVGMYGRAISKSITGNDINELVSALSKLQGEDKKGFLDNIRRSFVEFIDVGGIAKKVCEDLQGRISVLKMAFADSKMPSGVKDDITASKQLLALYSEIAKVQESFQSKVQKGGLLTPTQYNDIKRDDVALAKEITIQQQKVNELKSQAAAQSQKETQASAALTAQEEKVAQAKEKVAQATQAQAQATQQAAQAQSQFSQKEINTVVKNAVIEELKKSLSYISEAKEAIKNDSFTAFTRRVNNAVEAINNLATAFGKFHLTIGKDEGLRNFMTGLGEVIKNVRNTMGQLQGTTPGLISPDSMARSINVAKHEVEKLGNTLSNAQKTIDTFGDKGFDTSRLERYKMMLIEVRDNLDLIARNGGIHPLTGQTASQYLSSEDASRVVSLMNTELGLYKSIGSELERIVALREKLANTLAANPNSSYAGGIEAAIAGLDLRSGLLARLGPRDAIQSMNSGAYRGQLTEAANLIAKVNAEARQQTKDTKQAQTENDKWAASMNKAAIEATNLSLKIAQLEQVQKRGASAGIDTTALEQRIKQLKDMLTILQSMAAGMKLHGFAGDYIGSAEYKNAVSLANAAASAVNKNADEKGKAAGATRQLTAEEERLSQALHQSTSAANSQSQVLSDLKSMATQYLGVWGGQQFLHNIIEIGGQLEMQRLSIGAILQNTAQANTLFEQIKGLAVKSPFGVVQLDQMTKQLTAYGFKYNELFDMTKRLADISAATGTDVGRLALALGHVRSEAALSGYTLRQFAMGNVPLLEKLAEKFGKTTAEIRKMVKVKEITYEDVKDVLIGLTDEGGMFYNMQEVISQSVKAKFKNVKDAMDIMYGEMAESSIGDALKGVADVLLKLTTHWRDVLTVVGTGAAVWAANRLAILAYTKTLGASNVAALKTIATQRTQAANNLRIASTYRTLTAAEQSQIATSKRYTLAERTRLLFGMQLTQQQQLRILYARKQVVTDMALALSEKKLTVEAISRQVALGKLTKTQGMMIVKNSTLAASEKALAMQTVYNTKVLGFWGRAWMRTATAMGNFAFTLKSVMTSWQTWFTGVLMAGMEVWQHYTAQMEKAKEIGDSIYERGSEGIKNSIAMFKETDIVVKRKTNGEEATNAFGDDVANAYTFVLPKFDSSDAQASIDAWIQYIQDYAATPNRILQEALYDDSGAVKSLKEQFEGLGQAVVDVASAQNAMKSFSNIFENASMATFGVFDDDVSKNIKEYDDRLNKLRADATKAYTENRELVESIVNYATEHDHAFEMATKTMGTYSQKWFELIENLDKYGNAGVSDIISERLGIDTDTGTDYQTMMNDFNTFMENIRTGVEGAGYDLEHLSRAHQQALLNSFNEFVDKSGIRSDYLRKLLRKMFSEKFNIPLDIDDVKIPTKLNYIQERLTEVTGQEWKINMEVATNIDDAITEARQKYKSACDYFANVEPILAKFKIDVKLGDALSKEKIENIVSGLPEGVQNSVRDLLVGLNQASTAYNQATSASNNLGFTLTDPTNNSKTFKTPKEKKNSSSGSKEDKELKQWREQLDEIKKFYSEYKKYLDLYKTEERALAEMQKQSAFGSFFKDGRVIYDPNDMKKALDNLLAITNGSTEERKKLQTDIKKERADFIYEQNKKAMEEAANKLKEYISRHGEEYDLYKKFFEKTGNEDLSSMIFGDKRSWNNLARDYAVKLQYMMGGISIDYSMMEKDAEKFFGNNQAGFELWKKIVDLTRKQYVTDMEKAVDAYAAIMTIEEKILKTEQELNTLRANGGSKYEIEAKQRELNKLNKQKFEESEGYLRFYAAPLTMGIDKLEEMAKIIKQNLIKQLADGTITAQQYTKAIRDVNNNLKKGREAFKSDAMTFLNGGVQGIVAKREDAFADAAVKYSQAQKELEKAEKAGDGLKIAAAKENLKLSSEQLNNAQQALSSASNFMNVLGGIYRLIQLISGTLHGLQEVAKSLSEMFDALGKEGAANTFSDIADGIGAVTSAIDPISDMFQNAMKGNISGIVSSAISSPVKMIAGPITAIANLHDKKINRKIEKSVRLVKELENAYENMQNAIERRLTGIYGGDEFNKMLENYKDQLNELEYQRNKEADKKKKDNDKLSDYDQQIKEMRDTIKYFAEDMAKDLYDIDVKSWAKELTDAVVDAWAKGEDAAEAWHDKVIDIVKDVTKNILAQKVVEAALAPVLDIITGEMYNKEGKLDETTIPRIVAAMEAAGEGAVSGLTAILDGLKQEGIDLSDAGKSASSTNNIKGMSEETTDLLLSYVNAIRGDVSVNRELQTKIAANIDLLPVMSVTAQAQLQQLTAISQNTLRNADMAEQIYVLFNGLKTGAWRLEVQ